jgi:hypothetical protein
LLLKALVAKKVTFGLADIPIHGSYFLAANQTIAQALGELALGFHISISGSNLFVDDSFLSGTKAPKTIPILSHSFDCSVFRSLQLSSARFEVLLGFSGFLF